MSDTPASTQASPAAVDGPANIPAETPAEVTENQTPEPEVEPWRKVKHKYKAAGEIVEVDYDELVRRAQKADGAEKRLAEAARKEKEIQGKIEKLKTVDDISEVIQLMGGDERARPLLEKFLWDKIQAEEAEAKLTPTERDARKRAAEAEREAAEAKKRLKELDEAAENQTKAATSAQAAEIVNKEIEAAIAEAEKEGLSPEDVPYMVEELIQGMLVHLEYLEDCEAAGIRPTNSPLSPQDVLRKLRSKESERVKSQLKKLSAKELKELLTEEQLDGLRRSDIEALVQPSTQNRATAQRNQKSQTVVDPFAQKPPHKKKPNTKDWFSAMDQRYR